MSLHTDNTTIQLVASILKQNDKAKKDETKDQYIVRLQNEIADLKAQNKILCDHSFRTDALLSTALDEFEARFDIEKNCDSLEIAIWYCCAATQMVGWGRVIHNVDGVQGWIDNYVHPSTKRDNGAHSFTEAAGI